MIPSFTYLPFGFFLRTRLVGNFSRISWLFIYFIPGIFLYNCIVSLPTLNKWALLVLGIVLVNYVYENGYLENDVLTIKKEANPTLRLSTEAIASIQAGWARILIFRGLISALLLGVYVLLSPEPVVFLKILAVLLLLQGFYLVYNRIRNVGNLFLIIPLSYIRFYGFIIPFVSENNLLPFVGLSFFLYPFSKFIEFSTMPRYRKASIFGNQFNIDRFRVKYYFVYTLLVGLLTFSFNIAYGYLFLTAGLYYFLYRLAGVWALQRTSVSKDLQHNFNRSKQKDSKV